MWKRHSVCAVESDVMVIFARIDLLIKLDQIYLTIKVPDFKSLQNNN